MKNFSYTITEGEHAGKTLWSGRYCAVAAFVFCKFPDSGWHVLANKRGPGTPNYQGYWNCPCGYLEGDETGPQGCMRETYEETGVNIPEDMFKLVPIVGFIIISVLYLYDQGFMPFKSIMALVFIGYISPAARKAYANVKGCSGSFRRDLRLRGGRRYIFTLDSKMRGIADIELRDRKGSLLACLAQGENEVELPEKGRCRLVIVFSHAEGSLYLIW